MTKTTRRRLERLADLPVHGETYQADVYGNGKVEAVKIGGSSIDDNGLTFLVRFADDDDDACLIAVPSDRVEL